VGEHDVGRLQPRTEVLRVSVGRHGDRRLEESRVAVVCREKRLDLPLELCVGAARPREECRPLGRRQLDSVGEFRHAPQARLGAAGSPQRESIARQLSIPRSGRRRLPTTPTWATDLKAGFSCACNGCVGERAASNVRERFSTLAVTNRCHD